MIELINTVAQDVAVNQSVLFNATPIKGGCAERHRDGSSQLTLVKPGRYLVTFSGNIAIPTGGTVGEVSLGIARSGEIIAGTIMRATPAAVAEYFNISGQTYVDVYPCCCETISINNAGTTPVSVESSNLTAVRVCG